MSGDILVALAGGGCVCGFATAIQGVRDAAKYPLNIYNKAFLTPNINSTETERPGLRIFRFFTLPARESRGWEDTDQHLNFHILLAKMQLFTYQQNNLCISLLSYLFI